MIAGTRMDSSTNELFEVSYQRYIALAIRAISSVAACAGIGANMTIILMFIRLAVISVAVLVSN
jgi:hypothetical protein